MAILAGYGDFVPLHKSLNSQVYRAVRQQDQQSVILKFLNQDYPTPEQICRYKQEYHLTHQLDSPHIIKAYDLINWQNSYVIVFEDFGGISLREWLQNRPPLTLLEFFPLALAISNSLEAIHSQQVIHKDINPGNIVYNPKTQVLKIIDFGIATQLNRENPTLKNPRILEGTLAYISPEQTGRMNRELDYRSDFYSLGITFYEMLTGSVPFRSNDPLELVYSHIAQSAPPLVLPHPLPDIIAKLIAKNAEERYQSTYGLKVDLEICYQQLRTIQTLTPFPLGQQDISDRFQIPQKLYGREQEIQILIQAFERVTQSSDTEKNTTLMLVAGYSGIGKSSLVQELFKPITAHRGYFISGKFDQFQRNIPYSAIVEAFRDLIGQLLAEGEDQLKEWKEKIIAAVGNNGQMIIEVIPELELIIGKQPELPIMSPSERQNRFNIVFPKFIQTFTQSEHPLVLFLDDLQWADRASLRLMSLLMDTLKTGLFLIGAYRDNEVFAGHPLLTTLIDIQATNTPVEQITLRPLIEDQVIEFIQDSFNCSENLARPLGQLILEKTEGNPFFVKEFLTSLVTENLVCFDVKTRTWCWDLNLIKAQGITSNVVELMTQKIQKLESETQFLLQIAACIGNQFDLKTLAQTYQNSLTETASYLKDAIQFGLIISLENSEKLERVLELISEDNSEQFLWPEYKFVHDRVQQAAYSLLSETTRQQVHQRIGQVLLEQTSEAELDDRIFDIVNQLNLAINLIHQESEQYQLADLNLKAARKAKISNAYPASADYVQVTLDLLGEEGWQNRYDVQIEAYILAIEIAYLRGEFDLMNGLIEKAINQTKTLLDKLRIFEIQIIALIAQMNLAEAIDVGIEVLKLLNISFPKKPKKRHIIWGFLKTKRLLLGKKVEDLANLPQMTDPYRLATMKILVALIPAAYRSGSWLMPLIIFEQIALSVRYGNCLESIVVYANYGLFLCGFVEQFDLGYQFSELALQLLETYQADSMKAKVYFLNNFCVRHWKISLKELIPWGIEGCQSSLETGDFEYGSYCSYVDWGYSYLVGQNLEELNIKLQRYVEVTQKFNQESMLFNAKVYHQAVLDLLQDNPESNFLEGDVFNKQEKSSTLEFYANFCIYFNLLLIELLLGNYTKAYKNGEQAKKYAQGAISCVKLVYFCFYHTLTQLALLKEDCSPAQRKLLLNEVCRSLKKLKKWAKNAPDNHQHRYLLVQAEFCNINHKDSQAIEFYEQAIAWAKEKGYTHELAIAYELAGEFYLARDKEFIALAYLKEAYYCYQLWGARLKVVQMETKYPRFVGTQTQSSYPLTTRITTNSLGSNLDIKTFLKASETIARELLLDSLLSKLMGLLIENAGAQKGYLILEDKGNLLIEAEGTIENKNIVLFRSTPITASQNLAESIVYYVARTQESVVLNNAITEERFNRDPYIQAHHPQSILCSPLVNQGKLVGVIYLENNLAVGAFTKERILLINLLSTQAAISLEKARLYQEQAQLNHALGRFVPGQFLDLLNKQSIIDIQLGDQVERKMTVLFSDIRHFTRLSEQMNPAENFAFINEYLASMEPVIQANHGFIDKYIGDAIMALFPQQADHGVQGALAMLRALEDYNQTHPQQSPVKIGIGLHTGFLMLGTVGSSRRMDGTVIGDAVNLSARVETLTKTYGVSLLMTHQTLAQLEDPLAYDVRFIEQVKVKGKTIAVGLFEVFSADPEGLYEAKKATKEAFERGVLLFYQGAVEGASRLFERCLREHSGDRPAQYYLKRCDRLLNRSTTSPTPNSHSTDED
ncbi:AAA family ATPase [Spirulina subsalsa FACHB-351]|uniref:AAA family ATPase n=1 Tax=Spirulina subsalsa FACHB-351 TaxID=234711 RepID=A0ABT3KZX9_9CYAN|nr:AAA family ATPase [Spirulina subsalsa]MCW6034814.1 AAA family ATPase [Spirulina subsalsa FACHB-351]